MASPQSVAPDKIREPVKDDAEGKTLQRSAKDSKSARLRHRAQKLLDAQSVAVFLTILNIANCLLIGLETDCRAAVEPLGLCSPGTEVAFLVFEYFFLVVIICELLAHLAVDWRYVQTPWGVFDCLIAAASLFNACAIQPLYIAVAEAGPLSKVPGLRIFRLLRLSRCLVRTMRFPELWIMVRGLLSAIRAIAWILFLGTSIVFIFAIFGVESYSSLGPQWSRVGEAMMTLLQVATFDAWASVMRQVTAEFPISGHIFMLVYLAIVGITLMSLITAILTERTLERKQHDQQLSAANVLDDLHASQDDLRKQFPLVNDITKEELKRQWESDPRARGQLEKFGSLEELTRLFDLVAASRANFCVALNFQEFVAHMFQYKQDKEALLSSLTLEQLLLLRRKLRSLEHRLEASQAQFVELSAGASVRCAELASRLQEEKEATKCKDDQLRARWLGRLGLRTLDVTQLRHVFEAEDHAARGELDFDSFASFFPRASSEMVGDLWQDAAGQSGDKICFDDFLRVVSRNATKKLLRSASSRQELRSLCTPVEARKELAGLAARAAEDVVSRLAAERAATEQMVAERMAAHAAERAAERTADLMAESVAERISQRVLETLSQRAAECAVAEAADQFTRFSADMMLKLEESSEALRAAWGEQRAAWAEHASSTTLPEELLRAVQRSSFESAGTQTEGPSQAHCAESDGPRMQQDLVDRALAVAASSETAAATGRAHPGNVSLQTHPGRSPDAQRLLDHSLQSRRRPSPLQLEERMTPCAADTVHFRPPEMLRVAASASAFMPPEMSQEAQPFLMSPSAPLPSSLPLQPATYFTPLHSPFSPEQPSFTPSRRPACLLQQMESLAQQVSHLEMP